MCKIPFNFLDLYKYPNLNGRKRITNKKPLQVPEFEKVQVGKLRTSFSEEGGTYLAWLMAIDWLARVGAEVRLAVGWLAGDTWQSVGHYSHPGHP